MFKDGEIYDVIADAEYVPPDLMKDLSLRESDIPEYMENTNLRESNAVVRLRNKEDKLSVVKYLNSDGTVSDYIMAENVKYEKNGKIFDKTNKLDLSPAEGVYTNPDNDVTFKLPAQLNQNAGIILSYDKYSIELLPDNQPLSLTSLPTKNTDENGDYITYKNIFEENIDAEYHACLSGVKENIVLNENTGLNEFEFTVKTNGLILDENGIFYDEDKPVFAIGEILIFDSENNIGNGDIVISEEQFAEVYKYTINVDMNYLCDDSTVYPVTVDPYIYSYECSNELVDVEIKKNISSVNPTSTTVRVGAYTENNTTTYSRIFFKSSYLDEYAYDTNASSIFAAYLYIRNETAFSDCLQLQTCPITASWSYYSLNVPTSLYYSIASTNYYTNLYNGTSFRYKGVDITGILIDFCNETYDSSNGFCVKLKTETSGSGSCVFYSSDHSYATYKPYIVIMNKGNSNTTLLKNKGLYKVTNLASKTLRKVKSGDSYYLSYGNGTVGVGSTDDLSPFLAVNEVSNMTGVYTLSFICSKKENKQLYLNFYNQTNTLSLVESSNGSSDSYNLWYIIFDSSGIYWRIINSFDPRYFITSNYNNDTRSDNAKWMFSFVGLDVPLIKQEQSNWCGAASLFQIIDFWGKKDYINGNESSYQERLFNIVEIDDAANIYEMRDEINQSKYHTPCDYQVYNKNRMQNTINMTEYIVDSLTAYQPVILLFDTQHLAHYYPKVQRHFACIVGYDSASNIFILRDCNNTYVSGNYAYFGEYTATAAEIYTNQNNPYILCKDY